MRSGRANALSDGLNQPLMCAVPALPSHSSGSGSSRNVSREERSRLF